MSKARRSFSKRWKSAAPEAGSPAAWKRPFFVATDKVASNAEVANTIPRNRAVVQLGRTLEWGSRGRGFKSRRPEIPKNGDFETTGDLGFCLGEIVSSCQLNNEISTPRKVGIAVERAFVRRVGHVRAAD